LLKYHALVKIAGK